MRVFAVAAGLSVATLLGAGAARAYPQTIAKGYTNCVTCHYNPNGGGLANSYGHATLEATFPNTVKLDWLQAMRDKAAKRDVLGWQESDGQEGARQAVFHWDVGAESRWLLMTASDAANGDTSVLFVPMMLEAGGAVAYGPLTAYATLTVRRAGADYFSTLQPFSREHWLQWRMGDGLSLRAGRMVLPFGIRTPDHTLYNREDFGFDKHAGSYGLQFDHNSATTNVSVMAFAGDPLLQPARAQERGLAASAAVDLVSRASIGISWLGGVSELTARTAGALFARVRIVHRVYAMGELTAQLKSSLTAVASQTNYAATLRIGWFVLESLDLYGETAWRGAAGAPELQKARYVLGVNWQALPWIELAPALVAEESYEHGMRLTGMLQLHLMY